MELTLLEETSITLTELDGMDEERKYTYYYYIMAKKRKKMEEINNIKNESQGGDGNQQRNITPASVPQELLDLEKELGREFVSKV